MAWEGDLCTRWTNMYDRWKCHRIFHKLGSYSSFINLAIHSVTRTWTLIYLYRLSVWSLALFGVLVLRRPEIWHGGCYAPNTAFTWNAWECTTTSPGTSGTEVVHPHDYWLPCTESNLDEVGQLTNSRKERRQFLEEFANVLRSPVRPLMG